jgi:predicted HicB family RNase H-like nuclease
VAVTVKITVEVHRAAKLAAIARGMPLFAFVEEALCEKLARTKGAIDG